MNRRSCLVAAGSVGSALLAGCLGSDDEEDSHPTLQSLSLLNELDEPRTMELRIERDDTDGVVHDEAYELEASQGVGGGPGVRVDCVWPDEPLQLFARTTQEEQYHSLSTSDYPPSCLEAMLIARDAGTTIMIATHDCPAPDARCHLDSAD